MSHRLPLITFTTQTFCLLSLSFIAMTLCSFYFVISRKWHRLRFLDSVFHNLAPGIQTLFFIVVIHTAFLDGVWWFVLRPKTKETVDFCNLNEHGPINLVISLTELYLRDFYVPSYVLLVGFLYLLCYGMFLYLTAASTGEFVYFFLDITKPDNFICLLLLILWYFVCYMFARYFMWKTTFHPSTETFPSSPFFPQQRSNICWKTGVFPVLHRSTVRNNYFTFS
ncbi:hypothetical protein GAYE_SCF02G2166 [Galdieria yellowstonensis]|uniref:Uncharacterized protein n=1 Tax=Galdieria yellowstonensis TaxID=3028027 RepID=A0AAV9IAB9_9RHOD|nr:hypothetical protein GAYE_SCF02G2166 [Galdieria yellowstonensis]